jgi:hypothetical protein
MSTSSRSQDSRVSGRSEIALSCRIREMGDFIHRRPKGRCLKIFSPKSPESPHRAIRMPVLHGDEPGRLKRRANPAVIFYAIGSAPR